MNEFSEEELAEFSTEAYELLDIGEDGLLALDRGSEFEENYNNIFRVFHSLKGAAGMIGLVQLQDHMHKLENQLQDCQAKGSIPKELITYFLNGVDAARCLLSGEEISFVYDSQKGTAPPSNKDQSNPPLSPSPAAESALEQAVNATPSQTALRSKDSPDILGKIYIVDDEPEIVEILEDILTEVDFEVTGFTNPETLVEAVKDSRPDLVLADMKMPEMTGLEVLERVHAVDPELPVIFVSGHISKDVLMNAIEKGIYGVIEKPFVPNNVVNMSVTATKKYRMHRLLNQTINFIMFQFTDLDNYLKDRGDENLRKAMKSEIENLLDQRRQLRNLKASA